VSILPHEATTLLELLYLWTNTIILNGHMTSSKRMTFSLDNDICNGLVQWTGVVMVSMLASYVSGIFVYLHKLKTNLNPNCKVYIFVLSYL